MINRLSMWLANKLVKERIITENYYEVYKYGIEITISSIIGFLLTLLIGIMLKNTICSIVFYITFVCLRMLTGGFHATSYLKCNSLFCLITIIVLALSDISTIFKFPKIEMVLLVSFSIGIFWWLAPIENTNKSIENRKKASYKLLSIIVSICLFALSLFLYSYGHLIYSAVIVYSMGAVAVLCLVTEICPKEDVNIREKR